MDWHDTLKKCLVFLTEEILSGFFRKGEEERVEKVAVTPLVVVVGGGREAMALFRVVYESCGYIMVDY